MTGGAGRLRIDGLLLTCSEACKSGGGGKGLFMSVGVRGELEVGVECVGSTDGLNVEAGIDKVAFLNETT